MKTLDLTTLMVSLIQFAVNKNLTLSMSLKNYMPNNAGLTLWCICDLGVFYTYDIQSTANKNIE